jgi:uncharacterized protein
VKIVIPGGSGQVGRMLARHFHARGHEVVVLSRRQPDAVPWRVETWSNGALEHSDVCINLAGRSVNCRYNRANRQAIHDSRVRSTERLNETIASLAHPPKLWINASTATIYRHALDRAMDEATGEIGGGEAGAPDTWNFSIKVAKDWEQAFFGTPTPRTRKVAIRSAMTMSPDRGGVFDVLSALVRYGLGGTQGPGDQYVSWIHEADFVRAVDLIIARERLSGAINLASPNPLPNREFMRTLRKAWGRGYGLAPARWMIELGAAVLRTESELVLKSRRVVPGRLRSEGFEFEFAEWSQAARELVARSNRIRNDERCAIVA